MDPTFDRRSGIGASEVYDAIEGNPLKVWRRKVEGWEEPDNPAMKRGRRLERTVLEMYAETGVQVDIPDQMTWQHPKAKILFATPDAYRCEGPIMDWQRVATVDAKTTSHYSGWGEEGTAEVPSYVLFQGLTQMACTNLEECDIPVLMPNHQLRVYKILRDRETEGLLIEKVEQFWKDYVLTKKPPIEYIDGSHDWMDYLNERYPRETKGYLVANEELTTQCQALKILVDRRDTTETQIDLIKNIIRCGLEEHAGLTFDGGTIHYKKPKDSQKLDRQKVIDQLYLLLPVGPMRELLEQVIKNCTETKPGTRSLRPVWKDEAE